MPELYSDKPIPTKSRVIQMKLSRKKLNFKAFSNHVHKNMTKMREFDVFESVLRRRK